MELFGGELLAVASCSCSGVSMVPVHPSSYMSGTLIVVVAAAVVVVAVQLFSWEFLALAWRSCSRFRARPLRLSSFVSGTYSVGRLGEVLVACTSFAQVIGLVRLAGQLVTHRDTWRAEFGDAAELPLCLELIRQGVDVFALDYDVILTAMYALTIGAEGDCSRCVLRDPGIEAAALGASGSALPGTAPAKALHTFTLDPGASCCFFRDSTTLTPLSALVPVRLADPSGGPVLGRFLHCYLVFGGSIRLIVRSSPPLVLYELGVYSCPLGCYGHYHHSWGQRVAIYYMDGLSPGHVHPSKWVESTLLWHHHLGHPSLPLLHGMHSRLLVSSLPTSLPPLPPSPAPPYLPCVEGRQHAAPHSSFPPTTTSMQTLHMDVWGPARVSGQGHERYFLLVVDDYMHYTTVFPLRSKGEDLPVLRLHSDRGGEFSSDLLRVFCRGESITQSFTLPASPQQNGIAKRRIGLVMEVARTSMIHAAAPHFLWPFAVWYAAHQLNLWPRVSFLETSPTLRWTGEVGDASVFWIWGSHAFVRDSSADKLSARAIPCVFLGFPPNAPGWQVYNPTSRRVLSFQDKTVLLPQVSQLDPLPGIVPVEVAGESGAARETASEGVDPGGAEFEGAGSGGAGPGGAEPGGAEPAGVEAGGAEREGVDPGGDESEGAESGGAEPQGAASSRGPAGASPRLSPRPEPLSPQQVPTRDTGARGAGVTAGAGGTGGTAATEAGGTRGARTRGTGAAETIGVGGAGAGDPMEPGAAGAGGTGARGSGTGGVGAGGAGAGGTAAGGVGAGGTGADGSSLWLPLQAKVTFGPTSCREKLGKLLLWDLEEKSSCIKDLWQLPIIPWNGKPPATAAAAATAKATTGGEETAATAKETAASAPTYGALDAVKKVQQPQQPHGEVLAGVDATAAWAKASSGNGDVKGEEGINETGNDVGDGNDHQRVRFPTTRRRYPGTTTNLAALGFAPSTADPSLFLCTDTTLPPFYVLVHVDDLVFTTADIEALAHVKSELQKSHTCTDLGELTSYLGLRMTRDRAQRTITLTQSHMVQQVLQRFGFKYSSPQSTPLPTGHSLSAPPSDESVEPSGPYPELVGCLITSGMRLVLGGRAQGYTFSLGSGSVSWRSTRLSSVLSSRYEAEIYAGAMAAQELCWLTYLLTDLGEAPRSPPVLYVDNKAMLALCQEHRLEHRTKHIALRYFFARELEQRGQLRLAYVASRTNTADVFTKAL
ncbi:unnamed protein product [Closterium sp. NIES-53]